MALQEMYDYLPTVTPDYTATTLNVTPTTTLVESGEFRQSVLEMDDTSTIAVSLSTTPIFTVTLQWDYASLSDTGTILDFYFNTSKGFGSARSFYWAHPSDGHTYVVKFDGPIQRSYTAGMPSYATISQVRLRVIGRKPD